jgi:hypothetical protein
MGEKFSSVGIKKVLVEEKEVGAKGRASINSDKKARSGIYFSANLPSIEQKAMQNPDFIQKVLAHYNEELMPVPGTEFRYVSTDGVRLKFRDKRDVNIYVRIALVDLARSRHMAGKRVSLLWVQMQGNKNHNVTRLLKMLVVQFP